MVAEVSRSKSRGTGASRWLLLALLVCSAQAFAGGDPANGERLFRSRCIGCHALDTHRVGPALRGVVGRPAGSAPDYEYSAALRGATLTWTVANLDRWLRDPQALLPGQKMGYSVAASRDRLDLVAYLAATAPPAVAETHWRIYQRHRQALRRRARLACYRADAGL